MLPAHWPPLRLLLGQPRLLARVRHYHHHIHGEYPHLFPPRTYNEKIQYRKLFDRRPYLTRTADKFAVRAYAQEKLGLDLAPRLYHHTTDPTTIPFATLPGRFVVKPNHGSGWFRIVTDASTLDRAALIEECRQWLRLDFFQLGDEWAYRDIPRRILVEEFLDDGHGASPCDIRLLVFNQRVKIVQIDAYRNGLLCQNFFDLSWNELGVWGRRPRGPLPVARPSRLDDMIRYAEKLAEETDFVRVDFYQVGDRIVFGEMTHTPASGHACFRPPGTDAAWGKLWQMDYARIHQRRSS